MYDTYLAVAIPWDVVDTILHVGHVPRQYERVLRRLVRTEEQQMIKSGQAKPEYRRKS
jgi:hypothetical protein